MCVYNAKVDTLVTVQCSLKFVSVTVRRSAGSERERERVHGVRNHSVCVCMYNAKVETLVTVQCSLKFVIVCLCDEVRK